MGGWAWADLDDTAPPSFLGKFSFSEHSKKKNFIQVILKLPRERARVRVRLSLYCFLGWKYKKEENMEQSHAGLCPIVHPLIPMSYAS